MSVFFIEAVHERTKCQQTKADFAHHFDHLATQLPDVFTDMSSETWVQVGLWVMAAFSCVAEHLTCSCALPASVRGGATVPHEFLQRHSDRSMTLGTALSSVA